MGNEIKRENGIKDGVFYFANLLNLKEDGKFVVPHGVTSLKDDVFATHSMLKEVVLPEGLQQIGYQSFLSCKMLEKINIPSTVTKIYAKAFSKCESLKQISLPSGLSVIEPYAFFGCGLENIDIPEGVEKIDISAFEDCYYLENITLPKSLTTIMNSAFYACESLEYVKLPCSLKQLEFFCFSHCKNLKVVEMPSSIEFVGYDIFRNCNNLEKIIIDGKEIKINAEIISKFDEVFNFLVYASKNNKFVPKNANIMAKTNKNEIENFYKHTKDWKEILNAYLKEWQPVLVEKGKLELDQAITNLYQVSTALGLFAGGEDSIRAKEFIESVTLKMCPETIHNLYGALDTKGNGYNKEFADFYIKNYQAKDVEGLHFLEIKETVDLWEEEVRIVNYTANAYNNWAKVKKAYPNKTVLAHREQGSENNNLTVQDVVNALNTTYYENVDEDNEEMAEIVGKYGYSQEEFEELQDWYNKAKTIQQKDVVLKAKPDEYNKGVTYELLKKDDAEALILGEKTNCCQTVNDAGSSCVEYGVTKTNSGFVKFCVDEKIVGQSWVWYNEKTGVVCLDNIEVPTIWKKEMHKNEFRQSFINCVKRLAKGFAQQMEQEGHRVNMVTIGSGYNDLAGIDAFIRKNTTKAVLPEDYTGYSDAVSTWYVVNARHKNAEDSKGK